MFIYGEKHPVVFEIILIILSFLVTVLFMITGSIFYLDSDLSTSLARICTGILLLIIFRKMFKKAGAGSNPAFLIPSLLFAAWNVFYNISSGNRFGTANTFIEAFITALAPAIFEEALFRGIFLYNLQKKGHSDLAAMLISSLLFSALHLTNIIGMDAVSVALQLGYSLVIGMSLAAVYLKNRSILQVIAIHFLIDFSNRIYISEVFSSSTEQIILFVILLIAEAVYAVLLTNRKTAQ